MDYPIVSTQVSQPASSESEYGSSKAGYFRWIICALLLLGTTKNYMDRQVISVLKPTLQHDFGWSEIDYGNLVFGFQMAYAAGMLLIGRLIDRLGTRVGYAVAMVAWSLASMAHGFMSSLSGFFVARLALGFSEAGVFPASLKATAEWFPKRERALATGIFNAGTNVGAALAPLLVSFIFVRWGWRWAFFVVGGLGFAWLALWLLVYRKPEEHALCSAGELSYIRSDVADPPAKIRWIKLLPHRQTWAFALGKFIIDPVWWFYLFWIPDFLQRKHGLALLQLGLPVLVIYVIADTGSVAGGWLSSSLIRHGWSVNTGRKLAMLVCALAVVPIIFAPKVESTWGAVLLLGLAAAAHQGFSANLFTLPSDMFPNKVVASVVGIGGMAGAMGGMLIAKIVAYFLQLTGSYAVPFLIAGSAYLVALGVIQLLAPKLEVVRMEVLES
jgi:MFS transporter, ACS family, hexuronate transporter